MTVLGEGYDSVLHLTDRTATSVLSVSGANGLTLKEIAFADCTGVAVAASGTTGLTVKDCWYKAIGGEIAAVDGTYPVSIANGADSFVRVNQTLDGATYTAHVRLDGGSVLPLSEPNVIGPRVSGNPNGGVVLCVAAGDTEDFAAVFARSGYPTIPQDAKIVKVGAGTLLSTNSLTVAGVNIIARMAGAVVEEGTLSVYNTDDLGNRNAGNNVFVFDGATLMVEKRRADGYMVVSRSINIEGTGAPGRKGAFVVGPNAADAKYSSLSFVLMADTTFYNSNLSGTAAIFRYATVNPQQHVLTLKAATPEAGYRFETKVTTSDRGTVVADGVLLQDDGNLYNPQDKNTRNKGSNILLKMVNGTTFKPMLNTLFDVWGGIEMDETSSIIGLGENMTATIGDWVGCGTVDAHIASLTITNSLKVKAADLKAGNHLTVAGALVTRPEVRVTLEDAASLNTLEPGDAQPPFAFAASATSISAKPRRASGCDFAGWSVMDGEDGLSWVFDHSGMTLIIR